MSEAATAEKVENDSYKLSVVNTDDYNSLKLGQKIAFHGALSGENQLITGGGGVGKSFLINIMERHIKGIVITGTTGISAINILGQTIDSFMGFIAGDISTPERVSRKLRDKLKDLEVLLIDEASMMRIDKFEAIDIRLRVVKNSDEPFGGVQIILVGDFMQLPPVVNKREKKYEEYRNAYGNRRFLFESPLYEEAEFTPYVLIDYIRQGNDEIRQVLRNVRMGNLLEDAVNYLKSVAKGKVDDETIHLVATNKAADSINEERYDALPGLERVFRAKSSGEIEAKVVPERVVVKEGARVMICANNAENDYYNGDLGVVVKIEPTLVKVELDRGGIVEVTENEWETHGYEKKKETKKPFKEQDATQAKEQKAGKDDDKKKLKKVSIGSYKQMPLKLAWAITVHKSQGLTLDNVCIHFQGMFEQGQPYVALSRPQDYANVAFQGNLTARTIKFSTEARRFTMKNSKEALKRQRADIERFGIAA